MKKLIAFLLVSMFAFSLCGCTDSDDKIGSNLPGADKYINEQQKEDAPVKDGVEGVELPDLDVSGKNESAQKEENKTQNNKEDTQSSDTPVSSDGDGQNRTDNKTEDKVENGNSGEFDTPSYQGQDGAEAPSGGIELPDFDF